MLFLTTYIIFSILEKALNLKSPSQLELKIIDVIIGAIYGIILFSILFYFSYVAFFKNYIEDKNRIMKLNISIYENLMYKDPEVDKKIKKDSSIQEKKNDKDELY
jgi:hypothetical protein